MLPLFPNNSSVVFIGDSITAANLVLPRVIEAYKGRGITFRNCGVAGGTAEFAVKIFDSDVKRFKPTHAVISFGINDSRRELLMEERSPERFAKLVHFYELYKKTMTELVDKLLEIGVDVTLCTPVPYDEYSDSPETPLRGGYALMLGYAEFVRNLAREKGVRLYDQHRLLSAVMAEDRVISNDRIHPTEHGYFILARELLKEQGIEIAEAPIPEKYAEWHSCIARLRQELAAECMIADNIPGTPEEKMAEMLRKVENEDWGRPVFERFIKGYVNDKPKEEELYARIDELYAKNLMD